jgi:hypothetical protein
LRVGLDSSGSGKITNREEYDVSVWKSIPGFAKVLIILQTLVILFMSFWIYQEYLYNSYLQTYVSGYFQGGLFTAIVVVSIGFFTIVALALYAKLRSTRKELDGILSSGTVGPAGSQLGQPVDPRAEQHLIEMIRKTQPIMNSGSGTGGGMPVLRRVDSQSRQEEQESDK